ncbi:MAG TPA: carboxypeptidase-like regulatory domain-containing protein [Candidatus Dormibacteraeota bacterium]|nr:carboxypeptidase-like regulatory domain-containing protein [Candidatus Dormibacteraeota bacterium]
MKSLTKRSLVALLLASAAAVSARTQERMIAPPPPTGNVTLPLEEYNRLLALANKPPKKTDAPPLNYVIKRAELKLRVPGVTVLGTVQLDGETFTKAAIKVPLVTGMTVLDARLENKPLPLQSEGPAHTAVLPGASDFAVTLEAGLPLAIDAGRASFSLPVPAAGSARLTLVVPGDHTNVRISPGIITTRSSANGQTTVEATLVPGQFATIWWTTREVSAPAVPREVRFLSNVKTLVSVSESDLRIAALADITVVQGEPSQFVIALPAGYELTSATGAALDSSEVQSGSLILKLAAGNQKSYQFLISMEKPINATQVDVPFLTFKDTQRETGEILVEGGGTIELTAKEAGGLKRMDVKEVNPYLRSLVRFPMQAAFRYHKQPSESPSLALEWVRFPDSSVLAAIAERAVITTLVTSQGKSLTEVKLTVRNQAQPFLKVSLPQGATILSAEVAGEKVKPVQGADGNRVPLLRPNFRPSGSYEVSFVFMHSGSPFAKKGGSELLLPKMDVPINLMQWEVFLPEQYKVKDFGGDAIAVNLVPASFTVDGSAAYGFAAPAPPPASARTSFRPISLLTGQIGGYVTDPSGATVANAQVTVQQLDFGVTRTATTDAEGRWVVSSIPSGRVRVTVARPGFSATVRDGSYEADRPAEMNAALSLAAANQTVTVESSAISLNSTSSSLMSMPLQNKKAKEQAQREELAPSVNVSNFQRRVAGVLPVAVDVPHAGNSYRFVRPLVLDEETKVTFTYKTK